MALLDLSIKTAYEFGYGLSYTHFNISDLLLSSKTIDKTITATVTVTNTGKVAGKQVVQLYIAAPTGKLDKPSEELKAFAKTALLQPGQQEKITFTISTSDLASFDTETTSWVAAAGKYKIKIGASSTDIKQTADLTLTKDVVTEKCNKVLVPQVEFKELKK